MRRGIANVRSMPDAIFADPRLAPLYDELDGPREDLVHYLRMSKGLSARSVLDAGCGTGSLCLLLADAGLDVVGVDPALASLEVARRKPGADRVRWVHGDATTLPSMQVDLAIMTGNVAQVFLTDEEWSATLGAVRDALRPDGHLVFESRRPDYRAWEEWQRDPDEATVHVEGLGHVSRHQQMTSVALPLVSFRYAYDFPDGTRIVSDSTLRFRSRTELEDSLARAGLTVLEVRDAPDRPRREFVFVTQKRA
jgi:SAM-dependent methyltransferase